MLEHSFGDSYKQYMVRPVSQVLPETVQPVHLSLSALALGLTIPLALALHHPYLAVLLTLLSGYLDTLDGDYARHSGLTSEKGAVLDVVIDRAVEFAILFGLYLAAPASRATAVVLMLGVTLLCVTSFLAVGLFKTNDSSKGFYYSPGFIERFEAFILFSAMMLLPQAFKLLSSVYIILVLWTTLKRVNEFWNYHEQ